jgi:hypothetical protein
MSYQVMRYIVPFLIPVIVCFNAITCRGPSDLVVQLTEKPSLDIVAFSQGCDTGRGNTSVAFDATDIYKWSGDSPFRHESWGYSDSAGRETAYIKRDRDLGQTFRYDEKAPRRLRSVTVRTGFGSNTVRPGMYGHAISLQLFEVSGSPSLDTNGSGEKTEAFHGYPHDRKGDSIAPFRDDFYSGEIFTTLAVITGGRFPSRQEFGFRPDDIGISPDDPGLKGRYLKFTIPSTINVILHPGKKYAFLVMIDSMKPEAGFSLANNYLGKYEGGHGIRREGNGVFPPVPAYPKKDFTDTLNLEAMISAHFPSDFNERVKIKPGTNGYPDVCTWRDLEFYIEAR